MKIKVGDLTVKQQLKYCDSRSICQGCILSYSQNFPGCMCRDSKYLDTKVEFPDECLDDKKSENEKKNHSTFWNAQISQNDYRLQFQTTDEDSYKIVEAAAQLAVTISNKKKEKENEQGN